MYTTLILAAVALLPAANTVRTSTSEYTSCQPASAFSASSIISSSNSTFMATLLCSSNCASSPYFAVYSENCLCLSTLSEGAGADEQICDVPCTGYAPDTCGGNEGGVEYYSFFQHMNESGTTSAASAEGTGWAAQIGFPAGGNASATAASMLVGSATSSIGATTSAASNTPSVMVVNGAGRLERGKGLLGVLVFVGLLALL